MRSCPANEPGVWRRSRSAARTGGLPTIARVDTELRVQMRVGPVAPHERLGATMTYVTHDEVEATTMADRIAVLDRGRVGQIGAPPELCRRPRNLFVAGVIGSLRMNLVPAVVQASGAGGVTVALPGGQPVLVPVSGVAAGQAVTLGMRPEHPGTGEAPGGAPDAMLPAQVRMVEHPGGEILAHVMPADGTPLDVRTHGHGKVARSGTVEVGVRGALRCLFDASGDCLAPLHPRDLA